MGWNGLERNKLDYILSDLLPLELSEQFSYAKFYNFLSEKGNYRKIMRCIETIKTAKATGTKRILESGWATKPLKYHILKGTDSTREMSILQPLSALNVFFFMECYQKDILHYFERSHCFSIRYYKKKTDLYYKKRAKSAIEYFQKQSSQLGKNILQQTGAYFKVLPFESLNAFTDSRIWRMANFRYNYYAKIDYKSCFDSIYTHAYSWIIERNVIDAKNAHNPQLFLTIDRIMQNINGRSSNGIVVGPEFSRLIAEILLEHIDQEILYSLHNDGLVHNVEYSIYRYVDDIYIFANEQATIDKIIAAYRHVGEQYLLRLNELKLTKGCTPCLPKDWLEKTRSLADIISSFFYKGRKTEYNKLPDEERFIVKTDYIPVDRLKDEIAVLLKKYGDDRRTIVSFLLSTLVNNVGKIKEGYILFGKQKIGKAMLLLDLALFIYAHYPSYEQTRKIISIISYINSELDFKCTPDYHKKLCRSIQRYAFIFQKGNLFDLCDWFPFLIEYNIPLDTKTENIVITQAEKLNDPIIWGNILLYSKYNDDLFSQIKVKIENLVEKEISRISPSESMLHLEFWYVLVYHNCPYISSSLRIKIDDIIHSIYSKAIADKDKKPSSIVTGIICDFLRIQSPAGNKPDDSFFNWKISNNFANRIAYRTHQRTLFKKYRTNKYGIYSSLD